MGGWLADWRHGLGWLHSALCKVLLWKGNVSARLSELRTEVERVSERKEKGKKTWNKVTSRRTSRKTMRAVACALLLLLYQTCESGAAEFSAGKWVAPRRVPGSCNFSLARIVTRCWCALPVSRCKKRVEIQVQSKNTVKLNTNNHSVSLLFSTPSPQSENL